MTAVAAWKRQPLARNEMGAEFRDWASSGRRGHASSVKPWARLSLFGSVSLYVGDREVALIGRKACALVAYLALTPGMRESRDRLAGLLWSETENAKARSSLRQTLHIVRKAFHKEGLAGALMDNPYVRLDSSAFATDLDNAAESIERGEPADFLMSEVRITDTLLPGYDDIDPSYGSWLRVKRESVRQRLIRGLEERLSDKLASPKAMKRVACALFQLDPTNEVACRELMRAFMNSGNVAGALAAYGQLWSCLEEDYDIEPSAATQELAVAIKSGTYPTYQGPINFSDSILSNSARAE
jgi:DNA-binding SARP family transcriptional activator